MNVSEFVEVIDQKQLIKILIENGEDPFIGHFKLPNGCHGWNLDEKKIVVKTYTKYDVGLLIYSKKCLDYLIENDEFPVKDVLRDKESYKSIQCFKDLTNVYVQEFYLRVYNFKIDLSKIALEEIQQIAILERDQKRTIETYNYFHFCLGNYIKNEFGGHWVLQKNYGFFNPYYIPFIKSKNDAWSFYRKIKSIYFDSKIELSSEIDFDNFIKKKFTTRTIGIKFDYEDFTNIGKPLSEYFIKV